VGNGAPLGGAAVHGGNQRAGVDGSGRSANRDPRGPGIGPGPGSVAGTSSGFSGSGFSGSGFSGSGFSGSGFSGSGFSGSGVSGTLRRRSAGAGKAGKSLPSARAAIFLGGLLLSACGNLGNAGLAAPGLVASAPAVASVRLWAGSGQKAGSQKAGSQNVRGRKVRSRKAGDQEAGVRQTLAGKAGKSGRPGILRRGASLVNMLVMRPATRPFESVGQLFSLTFSTVGRVVNPAAFPLLSATVTPPPGDREGMDMAAFGKALDRLTGRRADYGRIDYLIDGSTFFPP